ncbi:MAG TPA: arsenate reductase ArsC [Xanthobacteraceae bacterium]|nr:arsenate reductase ArsC [Xanthobacteraceae bacterium]
MADAAGARPQAVLFLCGHNQVRSPMAAALAKYLFGQSLYVASAGVLKGERDPFVTTIMDEIGIDLSRHKPVTLDEIEEYEGLNFDLVVSLSPEAHHKALDLTRRLPFEVEYWPIPDPTAVEGSREQRLDAYRAARDDLMRRIKARLQWRPAGSV